MSKALERMLAKADMTQEDLKRQLRSDKGKGLTRTPKISVTRSNELDRILSLPRRDWEKSAEEYVRVLTDHLKQPHGQQQLRPIQAAALVEAHDWRGLFGSIRVGGGKCATFDTEVFDTSTGRRARIGELVGQNFSTVSMEEGSGRLGVARATAVESGEKDCFRLVLANGMALEASFDHPIYTARGWVWLRDLTEDDLVATARSVPDPAVFTDASDDEVKLAAYLLADGCVSQRGTTFVDANEATLCEVESLVSRLGGSTSRGKERGRCERVNIRGMTGFRDKWGIHGLSKDKRVPASFWGLRREQIAIFLNRFWACDGYYAPGGFEVCLASSRMIDDLQFLLLRLGIKSRKKYKKASISGKPFDAWRLSVRGEDAMRFHASVGPVFGSEQRSDEVAERLRATKRNTNTDVVPIGPESLPTLYQEMGIEKGEGRMGIRQFLCATTGQRVSRTRFAEACDVFGYSGSLSWLATSDLAWERIDRVEHLGDRPVFDLSVPTRGNFVANGIVIHNTLISLLACLVLEAKRPLLILPAKLIEKTKREAATLRKHWVIPGYVRMVSYELLGRQNHAKLLEEMSPDLIIADEAHKLKNTSAAVTRRVKRYMDAHPETAFVAMSGTITKRSLHDYAHLAAWALKKTNPTPATFADRMAWGAALDEKTTMAQKQERIAPGALVEFCTEEERAEYTKAHDLEDALSIIRQAYRRHVVRTPGFVGSQDGALGVSLVIDSLHAPLPERVSEAIREMQQTWERPDGIEIMDAIELWRHLREISCGFYYRWNPEPPEPWRMARSAWAKFVREVLRTNRIGLDSESQVARAVDEGRYPSDVLRRWRAVRNTFVPNTEAVWLHDTSIKAILHWAKDNPNGIVWVEHIELGLALEKMGLPYYGRGGCNSAGKPIEAHPVGTPLAASIASNAEGRNLQSWSANLITSPPTSGATWEQLLGRTHRDGQQADEVSCTLLLSLPVQFEAFERACRDAKYIQDTTGQAQKLCYADLAVENPWGQDNLVRKTPKKNA